MTVNEFLKQSYKESDMYHGILCRDYAVCNDGFTVSIQASVAHYCRPKKTYDGGYALVEVQPRSKDMEFKEYFSDYADDYKNMVYAYVPVDLLDKYLLEKHGGISDA